MKNVLAAARLVLADVKKLETPAIATAVAGVLVPIIAAVAGVNVTAPELAADLAVAGTVAATLQKLLAKPAPAPKATAKKIK